MTSLSEIGQKIVFEIRRLDGRDDPRYNRSTVSWLLNRDGWITPVWTSITRYSGSQKIVRFRNDLMIKLPRSQWHFELPKIYPYELTAHIDEMDVDLLAEVIFYAELARTASEASFDRHPPRFSFGGDAGHYGWTEKAWKYQQEERQ